MSKHPAADIVEQGFCTSALARDKDDMPCLVENENAVSFCALGAISKAYPEWEDMTRTMKIRNLRHYVEDQGYDCVQDWNDEVGKEAVVQTLQNLEI